MKPHETFVVGTRVAVYFHPVVFGVVVGRCALTGGYIIQPHDPDASPLTASPFVTVREEAFKNAHHVYVGERIVAGGPSITRERVEELAVQYGGEVRQGSGVP